MQAIPELSKIRESDANSRKERCYILVKNVNANVCMKRFKLVSAKSLVPSEIEKVSDSSYRFPVSDKYNFVFADKIDVRDKVDTHVVPRMFHLLKAAHTRNVVLCNIDIQSIGICISEGTAKILDMSQSRISMAGKPVKYEFSPGLYHAPEVHSTGEVSFTSDVYSLGLWWLACRLGSTVESWNLTDPFAINQHALSKAGKYEILRRMLNINPYARPSIQEVIMEYQRENPQAKFPQEQLTPSQSEVLRIFKGDHDVYVKLLEETHHDAVISAMPSILNYFSSYAPNYQSSAFQFPSHQKVTGEFLDLLHSLSLRERSPWENFVPGDLGDLRNVLLSFMSVDPVKALIVLVSLRREGLFRVTKEFGVEAIPMCKSTVELKSLVAIMPEDDPSTASFNYFISVVGAEDQGVQTLKRKFHALEVAHREMTQDYEELWIEYEKVWRILYELQGEQRQLAEKIASKIAEAGSVQKRSRNS